MLFSNKFLWLFLMFWKVEINCAELRINDNGPYKSQAENVIEKVFLKRRKRFLIFEKGAAVVFQGNTAKAIISDFPRGLNEIAEYSLIYDLPYELNFDMKTTTKTTTTSTSTIAPTLYDKDSVHDEIGSLWQLPKNRRCLKENIFKMYYNKQSKKSYERCALKRRVKRQHMDKTQSTLMGSDVLFELITQLSKIHNFNPRHCIMRTLCESQHLLLPPGQLLFHDLVHILLSHAQPTTQRHAPFRAAIERKNLQECTQLYGLHCRWSFLQHFTQILTI